MSIKPTNFEVKTRYRESDIAEERGKSQVLISNQ